ncbi:hypothetical protein [Amniculibacterium sp. G2-70]|uniref:hypothetical protein n=1 Tax=Amniculibacterium sp. G2-70 TaxID=2767188 RepID=UPI001CA3DB0C|nr:hypothetical protein [Amniculibacterium sp. G2-70]
MEVFFNSNPGLKSRFNTFIEFDDYENKELKEILLNLIAHNDYKLNQSAIEHLETSFDNTTKDNISTSANGRFVRNIFDDLVSEHARRVSKITNPNLNELIEITISDIENVFKKK